MNKEVVIDATIEQEAKPKSVALLFPGQGLPAKDIISFYNLLLDKNKDLTEKYLAVTQEAIEEIHGDSPFNISDDLKNEGSKNFELTSFVQPVIYTLSVAASEIAEVGKNKKISPRFAAGHSLGEYAALTAARVLPFETGSKAVVLRGKAMQEACKENPGKLISLMGLDEEKVKQICKETKSSIALVNAQNLIVVGTHTDRVDELIKAAKESGAKRITALSTAGAFHTGFMASAAERVDRFLRKYDFDNARFPVVSNLNGQATRNGETLKYNLIESMTNPVRWADTIRNMNGSGFIEAFVELGPGNSLASLNKINGIQNEQMLNINNLL